MVKLQEYLLNGGSLDELNERFLVKHRRHTDYDNLVLFTYGIGCKFDQPFHRECRGIILDQANNWECVSRPYDKFYNIGEPLAAEIDWNTAVVQEKLDGCFEYNQLIQIWDGSSLKIGDIVNKKLTPYVIGKDKNGNLVPSKVIAHKNNGTKTNWVELDVGYLQPYCKLRLSGKIKVTTNHKVFCNNKYIFVSDLKVNDELTSYVKRPDDNIIHVIKSSLLGDGSLCLSKRGSQSSFQEGHKIQHEGYVELLQKSLGSYSSKKKYRTSGFGSKIVYITSKSDVYLRKLREEWYPNGIKQIPNDLSWMDDFTVAKWYCDDGSLSHSDKQEDRVNFATNSFSEEDVNRLSEFLEQKYKVDTTVFYSKGWCLRINAGYDDALDSFWNAIAKYIPECMKYKLPDKYKHIKFIGWPTGNIIKDTIKVKIKSITPIENKKYFQSGKCGYDIETETNNYMCGGILVHNSMIQVYKYDNRFHVGTTGTPDAKVPVGDFAYTFENLFYETLQANDLELPDIPEGITLLYELCTEYNKIVVPHQGLQTYFIIARDTRTGNYIDYEIPSNFKRPRTYSLRNLSEILESLSHFKGIDQEGYVIVDGNYNRVKIKHPEYVTLHHAATGTTFTSLVELALKGEVSEAIAYFPHLTEKLNALQSSIEQQCLGIDAHYKLIKDLPSRKDFAMEAIKTDYSSVLFKMKDRNISAREVLLAERIPNIIDILKLKG